MAFETTKSKFFVNESASDWLKNLGLPLLKSLHCKFDSRPSLLSLQKTVVSHLKLKNQEGYFTLKDTRKANLNANKRILKWKPLWNKVYNLKILDKVDKHKA